MNELQSEVWQTVQEMNRVWTVDCDCSKLMDYFHEDMVAIVPLERERLIGREACIAGWDGFVKAAQIHSWEEVDPIVQVYAEGNCAVVTYHHDMWVTMCGERMHLEGRDMMTLVKENGRWWLVADQFSANP